MHANQSSLKMQDSVYHATLRIVTNSGFRTQHCSLYEGWSIGIFVLIRPHYLNCRLTYVLSWLLKPPHGIFRSCLTFPEFELSSVRVPLKFLHPHPGINCSHLKLDCIPILKLFKSRIKGYLSTCSNIERCWWSCWDYVKLPIVFFCFMLSVFSIIFFVGLYAAVLARTPLLKRYWT